jgi:hypothetical protein
MASVFIEFTSFVFAHRFGVFIEWVRYLIDLAKLQKGILALPVFRFRGGCQREAAVEVSCRNITPSELSHRSTSLRKIDVSRGLSGLCLLGVPNPGISSPGHHVAGKLIPFIKK